MVRPRLYEGPREERLGTVNTEPSREVRGHAPADLRGGRGNGVGSVFRGCVASKKSACQLLCRSRLRWAQSCGRLIGCSIAALAPGPGWAIQEGAATPNLTFPQAPVTLELIQCERVVRRLNVRHRT